MKRQVMSMAMLLPALMALAGAKVYEKDLTFKTYPYGDPNPVPDTMKPNYPYFMFDGTSANGAPQKWRAVILENDKVVVTMLPGVGGKVWGAVDKKSGREFIYYNHVVKFRNIAQRGPWCSGGIEFNFGLYGHGPWTSSPVAYFTRTNADGSVSCFVSETELSTRTTWQVEVNLPAEAEGFLTRTQWYNASGFTAPYYQWMNAAYTLRGEPEFEFPGRNYIGHGGKASAWPRDEDGHDLSVYAQNDFGDNKSEHVLNGDNGIYGIWWNQYGIGSAHLNHVAQKYGRKVWLWNLSRQGGIWEDLLTDSDGQYTELQSGRAFNQQAESSYLTPFKNLTFAPGVTDCFEEEWKVVRERDFFRKATDETRYSERPVQLPEDFDWESAYGHFVNGREKLARRFDRQGAEELAKCLELEPHFTPALALCATLAARHGQYDEAHRFAVRALALDTYCAEANYADGVVYFAKHDYARACERFGLAAYSPEYRAASYLYVAKAALAQGRWQEAVIFAEKTLDADRRSPEARLVKIAANRLGGDAKAAKALAIELLEEWPLYHLARHELNLADPKSESFEKYLTGEFPAEELLAAGTWYEEIGQMETAKALFAKAGEKTSVGLIRAAYLAKPGEAEALLGEASLRSVAFSLPYRREDLPALEWAVARSDDWSYRYLLAVAYAGNCRDDEAKTLLEECGGKPVEAVFYLYRASFRTGEEKLADLKRAEELGGGWRAAYALYECLKEEGKAEEALAAVERHVHKSDSNKLRIAYANALVAVGRPRDAVEYMRKTVFLPSEHGDNASGAWIDAWRMIAEEAKDEGDDQAVEAAIREAVSYPENVGVGKPYRPNFGKSADGKTLKPFAKWPEELHAEIERLWKAK